MSYLLDDVAECEICQENVDTEELYECEVCGRLVCTNCTGGSGPDLCYECFNASSGDVE